MCKWLRFPHLLSHIPSGCRVPCLLRWKWWQEVLPSSGPEASIALDFSSCVRSWAVLMSSETNQRTSYCPVRFSLPCPASLNCWTYSSHTQLFQALKSHMPLSFNPHHQCLTQVECSIPPSFQPFLLHTFQEPHPSPAFWGDPGLSHITRRGVPLHRALCSLGMPGFFSRQYRATV